MILSAIVAISANGAIGKDNKLLWHLPNDLKFFKQTTMGKPVIMGRKTFDSIGRPLPKRQNIILSTTDQHDFPEGVLHFKDATAALAYLSTTGVDEAFVIGGAQIYSLFWNMVDNLYVTHVAVTVPDADTYCPPIDERIWQLTWQEAHDADDKHAYSYRFCKYERKR